MSYGMSNSTPITSRQRCELALFDTIIAFECE
jgi:hypothetical protein